MQERCGGGGAAKVSDLPETVWEANAEKLFGQLGNERLLEHSEVGIGRVAAKSVCRRLKRDCA